MSRFASVGDLLGNVFDSARKGLRAELSSAEYERRRQDFVFHMSDWIGDCLELSEIFKHPDRVTAEHATTFIVGFLYHVIPHVDTAGRLLLDKVDNPFDRTNDDMTVA